MAAPVLERALGNTPLGAVLHDEKIQRRIVAVALETIKAAVAECVAQSPTHPGQFYSYKPILFPSEEQKDPPSLNLSSILASRIKQRQKNQERDYTTPESLIPIIDAHMTRVLKGPIAFDSIQSYKMILVYTVLGILYLSTPLQDYVKRHTDSGVAIAYFDVLDGGFNSRVEQALCGSIDEESGEQVKAALLPLEFISIEYSLFKMCF